MLILASASPRRAELLRSAGIDFTAEAADLQEARESGESPLDYSRRLARDKARAVAYRHFDREPHRGPTRPSVGQQQIFVLGADTDVCVDDRILGKPRDAADAAEMLRLLSNRWHEVTTGVCLISPGGAEEDIAHETTRVQFSQLSEQEVAAYVATGEPMDKAGAYAIQGWAARWIPRIEGDYSNVVGLPVALVYRLLTRRRYL
jgi:septum formation protein